MHRLYTGIVASLCFAALFPHPSDASESHRVEWRLLGNDTPSAGMCSAELTIDLADVGHALPLSGEAWLYFNFGRKPADPGESGTVPGYEHVNGDLFRLPLAPPDAAGGARTQRLISQGAVLSATDAPAGLFLVVHDASGDETISEVTTSIDLAVLSSEAPSRDGSVELVRTAQPVGETAGNASTTAPIVPQPLRYETGTTLVSLSGMPIVAGDRFLSDAELVATSLSSSGLSKPKIVKADDSELPAIRLEVGIPSSLEPLASNRQEAYRLEVDAEAGVRVVGATPAGLHYGVQSLIALVANATSHGAASGAALRETVIVDAPHFAYRGLHLDVARNFQTAATVRKLLDLMAAYKLNRFHFHLTDDEGWRVAIRGLPELTAIGGRRGYPFDAGDRLPPSFGSGPFADEAPGSGFYTREEFVALLRYANDRHIEVIPEIDLPGHARAAIQAMQSRYRRLAGSGDTQDAEKYLLRRPDDGAKYESIQMWNDNVVDVRLESTYAFIDHVVDDVASMFAEAGTPLKTLHIGGDEVPNGSWGDASADEKYRLFASFVDRFAKIAQSHGVRIGGWEEVFLQADHGSPRLEGGADGGLCYAWNNIWGWGQEDAAYRLANAGVDVVLCSATHLYFDLAYGRDPNEPGYYWAGVTDTEEVFRFRPYTHFEGLTHDRSGNPISRADRAGKVRLAAEGRNRIAGMQGQLWGETIVSAARLERMAFPRLLALAERAWAGPIDGRHEGQDMRRTWEDFARHLGDHELRRLDSAFGGIRYRVPSVQLSVAGDSVSATAEFPGYAVRHTSDGTDPLPTSTLHDRPLPAQGEYRFRCFDSRGRGGSISVWKRPASALRNQPTVR